MTPDWFGELLKAQLSSKSDCDILEFYPRASDQFFAEYLPAKFLNHLDSANQVGWRQAVERGLAELSADAAEYTKDYFLGSYRSDFVEQLNLGPGSTVLDLACGWGFSSQRCLEKGANVVGVEIATKRLRFCITRFSQQNFGERFVGVEMDVNRAFPFAADSFDAVIVSGLLEWVGCSEIGDVEAIQRNFMYRVTEILKPGGRLYLAIENRYWGPYFRGARDLHTNQRWVSILPRRLARTYSLLWHAVDYRAYCYSLTGYVRWLQGLGYGHVSIFYPDPDYVQPKKVERLVDELQLRSAASLRRRDIESRVSNLNAARFGRSFMFIATR